jgi:hypothetical protein
VAELVRNESTKLVIPRRNFLADVDELLLALQHRAAIAEVRIGRLDWLNR